MKLSAAGGATGSLSILAEGKRAESLPEMGFYQFQSS